MEEAGGDGSDEAGDDEAGTSWRRPPATSSAEAGAQGVRRRNGRGGDGGMSCEEERPQRRRWRLYKASFGSPPIMFKFSFPAQQSETVLVKNRL